MSMSSSRLSVLVLFHSRCNNSLRQPSSHPLLQSLLLSNEEPCQVDKVSGGEQFLTRNRDPWRNGSASDSSCLSRSDIPRDSRRLSVQIALGSSFCHPLPPPSLLFHPHTDLKFLGTACKALFHLFSSFLFPVYPRVRVSKIMLLGATWNLRLDSIADATMQCGELNAILGYRVQTVVRKRDSATEGLYERGFYLRSSPWVAPFGNAYGV